MGFSQGAWIAVKFRFHWTTDASSAVVFARMVKLTFKLEEAGMGPLLGTLRGT